MEFLFNISEILPLVPFVAGVILIIWLIDNRLKNNQLVAKFTDARAIFRLLVGVVVLGGVYLLDYSQDYGCIVMKGTGIVSDNLKYTSIALFLIGVGFVLPKRNLRVAILGLELTIWLYKLYFIKGGYNTGIGGNAVDIDVLAYDFMALTLRLALLRKINHLHINPHWVWGTACIVLYLRVSLF
ncbi:hypothetical protein BKI52_07390 [marine bacterium AO1-C]|nr:hypothetical protein BKI52_07390 [marine bacterium AO1-C]